MSVLASLPTYSNNHEPPPEHNARHRARDHGHVPVLRPGAAVGRDRPVHGRTGGQEVQREAPEPHPQKDGQQGYKLSHCRILRNIHRHLRAVLPVVRHPLLLYHHDIGSDTDRGQKRHREPRQGEEPSGSCSGNRP